MNKPKGTPSIVGVAVRDLARLRNVSFIVAQARLRAAADAHAARRDGCSTSRPRATRRCASARAPVRFAKLLAALGPTYIKLGQILSMRKDIFAPEWIEALETLQDDAPRLPFSAIREQVETSLGGTLEDLYASFEQEPLATASIAQTHRARTKDGDEVVVKVQRPGIESTMRSDLDLLYSRRADPRGQHRRDAARRRGLGRRGIREGPDPRAQLPPGARRTCWSSSATSTPSARSPCRVRTRSSRRARC